MSHDPSHGYDAVADEYMRVRSQRTGVEIISKWAKRFAKGASVLDIGAGSGLPLTKLLVDHGIEVLALDASPKMVAAFKQNLPGVEVRCEALEESMFFDRIFDGVMAIGVMFLLEEAAQRDLIMDASKALKEDGSFLFSAPHQICEWEDVLTGQASRSLGIEAYRDVLDAHQMDLIATHEDEGGSHYYEAKKRPA